MTYETLVVETNTAGIGVLTLNRPGKLNALTDLMFTELHAAVRSWRPATRCARSSLAGSGRGFCAGLDLDLAAELPTHADNPLLCASAAMGCSDRSIALYPDSDYRRG